MVTIACDTCTKKDDTEYKCECICGSSCKLLCVDRWEHEKERTKKIWDAKNRKIPDGRKYTRW